MSVAIKNCTSLHFWLLHWKLGEMHSATAAIYRSLLSNVICLPSISGIFQNIPCVTSKSEYQWRDIRWSRAFPRTKLGKIRYPIRVVPSSLRSLNLNNFHFATVSQVGRKFTGEWGVLLQTRDRHRVGMFLPFAFVFATDDASVSRKWKGGGEEGKKRPCRRKARASKKLRSQTVTLKLSASAAHDSILYVSLTKSATS